MFKNILLNMQLLLLVQLSSEQCKYERFETWDGQTQSTYSVQQYLVFI